MPQRLGLSFPVTSNHFVNKNNRVRLKCSASIARFYWKSAEVTLLQERPKFASVMTSGDDVEVEKAGKKLLYLQVLTTYAILLNGGPLF